MQNALYHAIGLVCAGALAWLGRFMIRHPDSVIRFFTLGAGSKIRFFATFAKAVGWVYLVGGILGSIMYLVMIPIDLLSSK